MEFLPQRISVTKPEEFFFCHARVKKTALEQIREALEIYLQLPNSFAHSGFTSMHLEPREQQLLANIQHLNGQLMLANAIAQAQGVTIQNQKMSSNNNKS